MLFVAYSTTFFAQDDMAYKTPPEPIKSLVDAPQSPAVTTSPDGQRMVLIERPGYPSIEELAQPELRLAGLRMNPRTNGPSRTTSYTGVQVLEIATGEKSAVEGLPENPRLGNFAWSPKGKYVALTNTTQEGIELWILDMDKKEVRRLTDRMLNDALSGRPFAWIDEFTLAAKCIPADREPRPEEPLAPKGPIVQESKGQKTTLRTYQDLLANNYDELLFEYYTTSELLKIDVRTGSALDLNKTGIIRSVAPSPNSEYLLVSTIRRPFSYLVPYYRFPTTYDVIDGTGNLVKRVADLPLIEQLPQGFGAVPEGPRSMGWRPDQPATLYWVEAQDGGDPKVETDLRDRLFYLAAPFEAEPTAGIPFSLRFSGINWGQEGLSVAYEFWWPTRQVKTSFFRPGEPNSKTTFDERSYQDRYNDPGSFVTEQNAFGRSVLLKDENTLYLTGAGASPEGDRPFLKAYDLTTGDAKELWRSEAPYYERVIEVLDAKEGTMITNRQSTDEPPNYYLRNWKTGESTALTSFPHPYPALQEVEKEVVKFERGDGLELQGDLYLPPGYDPARDGRLPVLMWAYPREYKSRGDAGQVSGSPYQFTRLYWGSPIYWVTRGYAVFDRVSMPVIGEGDTEPNDRFREQLVANAEAAIKILDDRGVADPERVGVGGHSYGAFMTANLLAHSDLFAAGIARSGAYNRTLTPFGFQAEERTYWDAPEIYYTMSPFMHADKINEPLLMIHGEADNNSGTFPIQSERMYEAINGLGGKARLVMLPHESHGYAARESIQHMLWEMDQWLEQYVKHKAAQP